MDQPTRFGTDGRRLLACAATCHIAAIEATATLGDAYHIEQLRKIIEQLAKNDADVADAPIHRDQCGVPTIRQELDQLETAVRNTATAMREHREYRRSVQVTVV